MPAGLLGLTAWSGHSPGRSMVSAAAAALTATLDGLQSRAGQFVRAMGSDTTPRFPSPPSAAPSLPTLAALAVGSAASRLSAGFSTARAEAGDGDTPPVEATGRGGANAAATPHQRPAKRQRSERPAAAADVPLPRCGAAPAAPPPSSSAVTPRGPAPSLLGLSGALRPSAAVPPVTPHHGDHVPRAGHAFPHATDAPTVTATSPDGSAVTLLLIVTAGSGDSAAAAPSSARGPSVARVPRLPSPGLAATAATTAADVLAELDRRAKRRGDAARDAARQALSDAALLHRIGAPADVELQSRVDAASLALQRRCGQADAACGLAAAGSSAASLAALVGRAAAAGSAAPTPAPGRAAGATSSGGVFSRTASWVRAEDPAVLTAASPLFMTERPEAGGDDGSDGRAQGGKEAGAQGEGGDAGGAATPPDGLADDDAASSCRIDGTPRHSCPQPGDGGPCRAGPGDAARGCVVLLAALEGPGARPGGAVSASGGGVPGGVPSFVMAGGAPAPAPARRDGRVLVFARAVPAVLPAACVVPVPSAATARERHAASRRLRHRDKQRAWAKAAAQAQAAMQPTARKPVPSAPAYILGPHDAGGRRPSLTSGRPAAIKVGRSLRLAATAAPGMSRGRKAITLASSDMLDD